MANSVIIRVGAQAADPGGAFQFIPPEINNIRRGTVVTFQWTVAMGNHSITQSSYANPCMPLPGGFDSGWVFLPDGLNVTTGPTFNLTITDDTQPIWFYCKQLAPGPHCRIGMVGAINSPSTGMTFAAFQNNARYSGGFPGQSQGGLVGVGASASVGIVGIPDGATAFPITQSLPSPTTGIKSGPAKVNVGTIAGGAVAGIIFVTIVAFLLCLRVRRRQFNSNKYTNSSTETTTLRQTRTHAVIPFTSRPTMIHGGPLPSKLRYGLSIPDTLSPPIIPAGKVVSAQPSGDLPRAERLRRERDHVNEGVAALNQKSGPEVNLGDDSSSGSQITPQMPTTQSELARRLSVLQSQIRQLEERQQHIESGLPPLYDSPLIDMSP